jgi:calcineurin-like phosphoesterase family protein
MTKHWFSADHHFNDYTILQEQLPTRKKYSNSYDMEEDYIRKWNDAVAPDDRVFYLGDFCKGPLSLVADYFRRLNGKITFLPGNHDMSWFLEALDARMSFQSRSRYPVKLIHSLYIYRDEGRPVVLFHFPLRQWPKSSADSWHLHGHSHGCLTPWGYTMDVGVDTSDGYLYSLSDVRLHFEQRKQELER